MRYDQEILSRATGSPNSRGWVRFHCPGCFDRRSKEDHRKSCGLNVNTGGYNCFACGLAGYIDGYGSGPDGATRQRGDGPTWEACDPPPGFVPLGDGHGRHAKNFYRARQYLVGRGVPPDNWLALGIGACDSGYYDGIDLEEVKLARRMNGRVVVPVRETDGTWRGYVGRAYYDNKFRPYMNHPGNWREDCVWNPMALTIETDVPVLVTEGLFDALPLYPDSVALLGKPSERQEDLLATAMRPVCMMLDGDAWRLSKAVALRLSIRGVQVGFVKLPPKTDPNDLDPERLMHAAVRSVRTQDWRRIH